MISTRYTPASVFGNIVICMRLLGVVVCIHAAITLCKDWCFTITTVKILFSHRSATRSLGGNSSCLCEYIAECRASDLQINPKKPRLTAESLADYSGASSGGEINAYCMARLGITPDF